MRHGHSREQPGISSCNCCSASCMLATFCWSPLQSSAAENNLFHAGSYVTSAYTAATVSGKGRTEGKWRPAHGGFKSTANTKFQCACMPHTQHGSYPQQLGCRLNVKTCLQLHKAAHKLPNSGHTPCGVGSHPMTIVKGPAVSTPCSCMHATPKKPHPHAR